MLNGNRILLEFLIVICVFITVPAIQAGGAPPAKDILLATVNSKPITLLDILAVTYPQEQKLAVMFSGKRLIEEKEKLRDKTLDFIIDRKLVYEQFNKKKYKVPKQIVEKMLDELAAELAGGDRTLLERKARKAGMTMEELREQARERAATSMLLHERCYKVANVTPKEVYEYFRNHADDLGKPASVKLQVLYLKCKPEDQTIAKFAEKLAKQLEEADEKTFAEYVRKYSNGPNTETDGSVGWIPEDKMRKDFKEALGSFQDGKIAGPVKTDEGYYFIRVMAMKGPVTPDFNGVKEEIKKKLSQKEEEKAYKKYISFLKRDAVIRKLMPTVKK